jgi:hypothetical protein
MCQEAYKTYEERKVKLAVDQVEPQRPLIRKPN